MLTALGSWKENTNDIDNENDNVNESLAQVEWRVLRLLDTIALENYDNFNVLDMLPPPQNVMVPTEDEWERILAIEAEREENPEVVAESHAGKASGSEPPKMDRDTMKVRTTMMHERVLMEQRPSPETLCMFVMP